MYDRAPRVLRCAEGGSTEDHVGPGSYQVPFPKQQARGGYAPFLSLAAREIAFTIASNTEKAVPGPGHYNVSEKQCNIKGGRSLQNQEKRFKKFISDSPGPASYDQSCPGTLHTMKRKVLEAKEHLQSDISSATLKYKGIHFGKSLGRFELPIKSGPGPGQYDIVQKNTPHYENVNIKKDQLTNYCPHLPRFYEVIILQEEKKGVPGPGKYDIKSQFQKTESVTPNVNDASHAFRSQSQRFASVKSTTPAPGTYKESRTAFKSLKKTPTLKNIAFGQSTVRFPEDSKTEEMPGPGFYTFLNNTIIDNVSNTCLKKKRKDAFGSSVPRTFLLDRKEAGTAPRPAVYQDTPTPGSYDGPKSYELSQVQRKYMPPYNFVAKIKHTSFLSTTPLCLDKDKPDGPDKLSMAMKQGGALRIKKLP
uniref:Sperm tail PG-rich repeat containing 2 n=1 Tax=Molossus molossus TaxID=27622 RepID=A0A7J8K1E0_MOLMO|nr:sperm tail PG-rich repeat containing 2 [Molossus molossus]